MYSVGSLKITCACAINVGAANVRPDSRWRVHLGLGYTQIGILFLYSLRVLRQLLLAQKH